MQLMQQVAKKKEIANSSLVEKDSNGLTGGGMKYREEIKRMKSRELCSKCTVHDINITDISLSGREACAQMY